MKDGMCACSSIPAMYVFVYDVVAGRHYQQQQLYMLKAALLERLKGEKCCDVHTYTGIFNFYFLYIHALF